VVTEAIAKALETGTSFGAATRREVEMAQLVIESVPSIEMVRMVNSGTEATMSAVRVARAFTGREKVIKFEGCYHGHADSFLIKAGSGALTLGIPDSPGVTAATGRDTLTARFNDLSSVEQLMDVNRNLIAAVIVEPIVGNMGCIPPQPGFLEGLRSLCTRNHALLIFDEVMTGFRVGLGGAQQLYGIRPDLTTLGKIIGGGLPVGAYGGKKEIMQTVAPSGPVYQAGTLSGNPLAMAAGVACLRYLRDHPETYAQIDELSRLLTEDLAGVLKRHGLLFCQNRVGSMFTLFFTKKQVTDYESAKSSNTDLFARYFLGMLGRGVYLAPSQFEAAFLSAAHTRKDIEETIEAAEAALSQAHL